MTFEHLPDGHWLGFYLYMGEPLTVKAPTLIMCVMGLGSLVNTLQSLEV